MKKDLHQRRAYAMRRVSRAIDRMIQATAPEEKKQAALWSSAWASVARVGPAYQGK